MITFYRTINNNTLNEFNTRENALLDSFKKDFFDAYSDVLLKHKIHGEISIYRWTDTTSRWQKTKYDGYSAMIQVDLLNSDNSIIELDESVCSCFLTITFVAFVPIRKKYRVYQADDLGELWDEIRRLIHVLNASNI